MQHIVVCYNRPSLRTKDVNELDAIKVQSIQLHLPNSPTESAVRQVDHWQVLAATALGIGPVLNWFVIAEIIPKRNKKNIKLVDEKKTRFYVVLGANTALPLWSIFEWS